MPMLQDLVGEIIRELTILQKSPSAPVETYDHLPIPLPRTIPVGYGRVIAVSKRIEDLIISMGRQLVGSVPGLSEAKS